jgi:simple sugar transport system permease protein
MSLRFENKNDVYAGWDANWYFFFLGLMLLLATVANNWVRNLATRG